MEGGEYIEIAGGAITEKIDGDYDIYSGRHIINTAGKSVIETGKERGVSFGEPKSPAPPVLKSKCMILFRPYSGWSGEFGFDWIRAGDTGQKGDTWYKDIIGNYRDSGGNLHDLYDGVGGFKQDTKKYDKLITTFKSFIVPWKPKIHGNPYLYITPVLSLLKGNKATLTLKIDIAEEPKEIKLKNNGKDISEDKDITFNHTIIETKSKGKHKLLNYLTIECKNEFNKDKIIEVMAVDKDGVEHLAGQLKILANALHKKIKVLFVKITTSRGIGTITGEKERLEKYMQQAYVNVEIKNISLNLSSDVNFINTLRANANVHQYLDDKLRTARFPSGVTVGNLYDNFFRIYFINEVIQQNDGSYLLGQAQSIPSKTVYVLNLAATAQAAGVAFESVKTTATHELLHAIGLYHSFDNNSLFTLKKYLTDNIMDYYTISTDIKAKQMYKWQWEFVRSKLI